MQDIHHDTESDNEEKGFVSTLGINRLGSDVIWVDVVIDKIELKMELDTGSAVSVMAKRDFDRYFPDMDLHKTKDRLRKYTCEKIIPVGVARVNVGVESNQAKEMDLYVVEKGYSPLLGRDWFRKLPLNLKKIANISPSHSQSTEAVPKMDG